MPDTLEQTVVISDDGFGPASWSGEASLDLAPDADLDVVLRQISEVAAIRIAFPSFADGRGFSLARGLRRAGFKGRLRAAGHVIADQYAHARESGFDEVEISAEQAARQPEASWRDAFARTGQYQRRLR